MQAISRREFRDLLDNGKQIKVVDVLGEDAFREFHIPGAINVPLGENFDQEIQDRIPSKKTPVVVYCMDMECQASAKAAARLDELGYSTVYDYEAGKEDWKAAGMPVER